jgi:magnesium-transporting ATPase (P-type)
MASLLSLFGRTLFNVLLGLVLGYGVMDLMLSRTVPEALKNEKFLKYREMFMIIFIILVVVCMYLVVFT